jgi:DNA primase
VTGASGTPGEDALSPLLPFDVVLWPDHDEPGEQHMTRVAATLLRLGGRARRLAWGTKKGDDAADFWDRGGKADTLKLLIQAATPYRLEGPAPNVAVRPSYEHHDDARVETARSHLLQVVEEKLGPPKRRMGRSLFWACPFHAEATPSFKVDTREPFYRCFGCSARGDVFTFLRAMEGVAFKDALRELAPPSIRTVPVWSL